MKLIFATKNKGKVNELSEILKDHEIITMSAAGFYKDIVETGKTFEENSLIKARAVCSALGKPSIADDSGLEVYALDMCPGIYSARYAGEKATDEDNIEKLLKEMRNVKDRHARFVCCAALAFPDGRSFTFQGEAYGTIGYSKKGSKGFGYDPVFIYKDGRTYAEIPAKEKNIISHRFRAFLRLSEFLKTF